MIYKANPFDKFLTKEDKLHRACCHYLNLQYPEVLYTHPVNEGKRSPFEQYKAKILGMKPGVPDLLIFEATSEHRGLAIEFKVDRNKPTESQVNFQNRLKEREWRVEVIYTLEQFIEVADLFFTNRLFISA